jgi:hypothetical protein
LTARFDLVFPVAVALLTFLLCLVFFRFFPATVFTSSLLFHSTIATTIFLFAAILRIPFLARGSIPLGGFRVNGRFSSRIAVEKG